jgi:hypothetical protein
MSTSDLALGLSAAAREQFDEIGYVRIAGAFGADEAADMRAAVWASLATRGIHEDEPSSWREEAPYHLQHLKGHPAFRAIGSQRTLAVVRGVLGHDHARAPGDWGAFFLLFPNSRPWFVPWQGWHIDHEWTSSVHPTPGVKVHALFGDVERRAGGMTVVTGSHHVVERVVADLDLPPRTRAAKIRAAVMRSHPYLRDLSTPESGSTVEREERIARFVDHEETVFGVPLRVQELTGSAGDVLLIHPLLLHTRPTNAGTAPRFLLNKDLRA